MINREVILHFGESINGTGWVSFCLGQEMTEVYMDAGFQLDITEDKKRNAP